MGMLTGRRILVVEDEMIVAMLLEDMLAELGCEVVGVANRVAKALAMIEQGTAFDAAVLDLNLHGEKSFPVAAALTARGRPFVFSTGYGRRGVPDEFRRVPLVEKPYSKTDVERLLMEVLMPHQDDSGKVATS
jgi:CheY-like chemotaxis protein